jgi:hypothetical protein
VARRGDEGGALKFGHDERLCVLTDVAHGRGLPPLSAGNVAQCALWSVEALVVRGEKVERGEMSDASRQRRHGTKSTVISPRSMGACQLHDAAR